MSEADDTDWIKLVTRTDGAKAKGSRAIPKKPTPIAPGDVVRLKSGGPAMTVVTLSEDEPAARCLWFADGVLHEAVVLLLALVKVEANDG